MSSYRGHISAGCLAFFGIVVGMHSYICCPKIWWLEFFLFTMIGSLFPDIDIKSKGQQITYTLILLVIAMLSLQGRGLIGFCIALVSFLPLLCKHRGLFHNPFFLACGLGALCLTLPRYFPHCSIRIYYNTLFFTLGIASHLFLDHYGQKIYRR